MKRSLLFVVLCATALHAQQRGQGPDFTANIDYVEIPVRVIDNKGRFVRGLTQHDFEILEDGAPQRIVNFSFAGLPPNQQVVTGTGNRTPPEPGPRAYAVVLDDVHLSREDTFKARSLTLEFVRRYVPADDSIAIVFTSGSKGQELTRDRATLSSALDRLRGQWEPGEPGALRETKAIGVVRLIAQVSRGLAETAHGARRAIVLVSAGVGCSAASANPSSVPWCGSAMTEALREAVANDIVVYSVEPGGNQNPAWRRPAPAPRQAPGYFDGMHSLANETGGFSVSGTDAFADAFKRIVSDFSEYYLLGYYAGRRDAGQPLRRSEVRVNRSGAKAFYRSVR
jgi:VWFA-related protein